MQIFRPYPNPGISAVVLDDARVARAALQCSQVANGVSWLRSGDGWYKHAHTRHPCVQWATYSKANYRWLMAYWEALDTQYSIRYPGKVHSCGKYLSGARLLEKRIIFELTLTPQFVGPVRLLEASNGDTYKAYRALLRWKWEHDKLRPRWFGREDSTYAVHMLERADGLALVTDTQTH